MDVPTVNIVGIPQAVLERKWGTDSIIDVFMASIDAKDTTRATYRKAIELFFSMDLQFGT